MGFITSITNRITDWPKDGQSAQEARDDAVKAGLLPPTQAPHLEQDAESVPTPDDENAAR